MKAVRAIVLPITFVLIFILGFIARGLLPAQSTPTPPTKTATTQEAPTVTRILDGDTIELADGTRIRYAGIDAPELHERFGTAAYELNTKLVKGKVVRLELSEEKKDLYGRTLAYVYLPDGTFVNEKMIEEGYATVLAYNKMKKPLYYDQFLATQKKAQQEKRGMWYSFSSK